MFREIFRFELRFQLRQPAFWLCGALFFLLSFFAVTSDAVVIGGAIGSVNRNAPYVVMQLLAVMSVLGVFVTTAFVAGTVLRDDEHRTQALFFSTPVAKRDYLFGRFLGALAAAMAIYVLVALAVALGGFMPWLDPARIGPFAIEPYLFTLAFLVAPNVLLMSAVFFGLATVTRSIMWTYVGVVAFFVGYAVSQHVVSSLEHETLAALADPFGMGAVFLETRYWTPAERNTQVLALEGALLHNRLLWTAVAALVLAATYARFSFRTEAKRGGGRAEAPEAEATPPAAAAIVAGARRDFSARAAWMQYRRQTGMEIGRVVRSVAFGVIMLLGVVNIVGNSLALDEMFGTPVYPVTLLMTQVVEGAFLLFALIILTFYSGEGVWRERQLDMADVFDALPVPSWVYWASKATALVAVIVAILTVAVATGMGIQLARGYTRFELPIYLGFVAEVGVAFSLMAVLALFLQVATNSKYLGFLLMILYYISSAVLSALDFDHNLYQYASAPASPYSDMNGFGHFVEPTVWFYTYWGFAALVLLVATHLFWVRGRDTAMRFRLRLARARLGRPALAALALGVAGYLATGGFIYYNTNVLNEYVPGDAARDRQAAYEKTYKKYEGIAQPRVQAAFAEVDIYPERRDVDVRGRYTLRNTTAEPIDSLHLTVPPALVVRSIEVPGGERVHHDTVHGYSIYRLAAALEPGQEMELRFDVGVDTRGFVNHGSNTSVVENGTFFNNGQLFPSIGYARFGELQDPNERRKRGLPPVQRMRPLEDESARGENYITQGAADWIDFETVVSTSEDQIALAPGYLQREWTENGRRYFHYRMDSPILAFWAYLSARYEVARDEWNGVAIEVYHHAGHPYNVQRMIDAVKKSLAYFTESFGPYQHRQVRIVEFPRYASFAQSFPNTIPFSESIGFIARIDEAEDIDYVFYVTAHEVAHQWWGHQVVGANAQGATVLVETLAQYSALMVMEQEYGRDRMRRFLEYELDNYLRGRGGERIEEQPLLRVENQGYIHYRKGSLVMYALRDYLGEERLNAAIRGFLEPRRFGGPPYPTSADLLAALRQATPPEHQLALADLFERITLYDNRATAATWQRRDDGRYAVRVEVSARKRYADGQGEETDAPLDEWVDVAVFGEKTPGGPDEGRVLTLEKRRITGERSVFELVVDEEPRRAGVDPYNKLIDRNPGDNVVGVEKK